MDKTLKAYFIVMVILSFISLFFPLSIFYGLFLFVVPGLVLLIAPTTLFYSFLAYQIYCGLEKKWQIRSMSKSLVLSLLVGASLALVLNIQIFSKVHALVKGDVYINLDDPIHIPHTVALLTARQSHSNKKEDTICSNLCFKMLLSGAAKRVIMSRKFKDYNDFEHSNPKLAYYELRKSAICDVRKLFSDDKGPLNAIDVAVKAYSGDCVIKGHANLKSADMFLNIYEGKHNEHVRDAWRLDRQVFFYKQIELIEKKNNRLSVTYRKTKVKREYFIYPLSFGTYFTAGGGNMGVSWGFYHFEKTTGGRGVKHYNYKENIKRELKALFPNVYDYDLKASDADLRRVTEEILSSSEYSKIEKNRFFEKFTRDLRYNKDRDYSLSGYDIDLVALAVKSDLEDYWALGDLVRIYGEESFLPMRRDLLDKLLKSKNERVIKSISSVFSEFSQRHLIEIAQELSKASLTPQKRIWISEKAKGKF